MCHAAPQPPAARAPGDGFATTRWSIVLAAGQGSTPEAQQALATLCETYWYPLYAFVRRQGYPVEDAKDLVQGFFARFLEKHYLQDVQREKGKFRAFLLVSLQHFLANEWDKAQAQKRGGGIRHLSLDLEGAENKYRLEPAHNVTPEKLFERQWALAVLARVLTRLQEEYRAAGHMARFDQLKSCLTAGSTAVPYSAIAGQLGMSEGAVRVAVNRLRRHYGALLREEIAQTVATPTDIDVELRALLEAMSD